ncbi:hypothetical protein ACFYO0_15740 [Streptomyces sp. NPDC006365]|uniref:hypothetical protein n=1 Tax=Streptomyces sp. NPDC006365 TaxID=3364744 RepID=UPI0036B29DFE
MSHGDHDNPWQWRDGHNPYYRTPLQILGLDPDRTGRAAVRAAARRRRLRVERGADRFPVFGRPLEIAEVNAAEEELLTPTGRLLAELRTHRPARHQEAELRAQLDELAAEFASLPEPETPEPRVVARPEALLGWLPRRPGEPR